MSGLETAIRNALERSDRANAETRARVYQSARQALETGLGKQNIDDPEAINYQRRRLEALIHSIEQEERARLEVRPEVSAPQAAVPVAPTLRAAPEPATTPLPERRGGRVEPGFASLDPPVSRAAGQGDPSFDDEIEMSSTLAHDAHANDEGPMPDMRSERPLKAPRRRRGLVARLLMLSVFVATLGIGAWWVYSSGLLLSDAERDTSVPNPPPRVESEDFSGTPDPALSQGAAGPQALDARGGFPDDWIEVFEPQQVSAIRPRANALVDIVAAGDGNAAQIVSRSRDAAGAVEVTVPADVLREMAGRTSTIALTLQSTDDKPVQISVECDFPRMSDCPRHRFTVNPQKLDALFRVSFENDMAPSTPGRLLINADIEGGGRGVNLYAIRVLPGQ
ncbi:FUSC family protein [Rhizobium sp. 'Codium 1']|uniref:FUSC family protein n=1 Tax=Rhizobium sp. 'Codium 1' TaxID=2940484 RepID=UPI001E47F303|nr:FUSC family protein [Rhizobium sp. 'Codium 1']MCC8931592.1 FUSC family protein [Rhizobium sp. 'Codium 1']